MIERRIWNDLSKREATNVFNDHVASHPQRVEEALDYLRSIGAPDEGLDFSRRSLQVIWPLVLAAAPPIPERPNTYTSADELAYWARFRLGFAERIGPDLCRVATLVAAYFSECVLLAHPDNHWGIANEKGGADFRQTQLVFHTGPSRSAENLASNLLTSAIEDDDANAEMSRQDSGLRRRFDTLMHIDPETPLDFTPTSEHTLTAEAANDAEEGFEITILGDSEYHVSVTAEVDDTVDQQIDELVKRLQTIPTIRRVHREDREVILITADSSVTEHALKTILES